MSTFSDLINGISSLHQDENIRSIVQGLISSNNDTNILWIPYIDIIDTPNNLYVYADLPGVFEDNIDIDFFNNKLTITGEKIKRYVTPPHPIKSEISYGKFKRELTLPISVTNTANVDTTFKNGTLIITIDKQKECQNKFRINLKKTSQTD